MKPVLSDDEVQEFITHGIIKVPQALDPTVRKAWVDRMWVRLGYDPEDPSTWTAAKIHMPNHEARPIREIAPRAWSAICQLCGGEERIHEGKWGDGFIANFHLGEGKPWQPPGPEVEGWHKDGDFFLHFLDSPEQALLTIVLWSDVHPRGGATFVAPDSIEPVARFLQSRPEGVEPSTVVEYGESGFPFKRIIAECKDFREATGKAGDVYLMHPFMMHASSYNELRLPRLITNPPVSFKEPMRFDRDRPEDTSPVERAVLRALGVDRLAFAPTAPRRRLVPARLANQAKLKAEEDARLKQVRR